MATFLLSEASAFVLFQSFEVRRLSLVKEPIVSAFVGDFGVRRVLPNPRLGRSNEKAAHSCIAA